MAFDVIVTVQILQTDTGTYRRGDTLTVSKEECAQLGSSVRIVAPVKPIFQKPQSAEPKPISANIGEATPVTADTPITPKPARRK